MRKSIFLSTIPFLLFVFGYSGAHFFFHTKSLCAPNLIGKPIQRVVKEASDLGLNIRLLREQKDPDLPDGIVLEQAPKASRSIKPNQHIFVTLSRRPASILTPDVLGLKQKNIALRCKKLGIQVRTFWLSSHYPKDCCISQSPYPGQAIDKREFITYLSSGKKQLYVFPDLRGESVEKVKKFLMDEGIHVDVFSNKPSDYSGELFVADQKPMPGSIVDKSKKLYVQIQAG